MAMKMILTGATTPDGYMAALGGWQRARVETLRGQVRRAVPAFEERLKWGHLVYFLDGPALLIRAEPTRVLFGFWRGQRIVDIEPRLTPGGKYEMATLVLVEDTKLAAARAVALARAAAALNRELGDPTAMARPPLRDRP